MNDLLPDQLRSWQYIETVLRELFAAYAYREIRFPIVEQTELFARSIGGETDIVAKEMYTFEDRNGDSLSLRPEGTASCVRAALEHGLLHNQQHRVWYMGPMFRHERPQRGRYRQFHQAGAEAFGWEGPDIDAELIALTAQLWRRLGLRTPQLEINSLGDRGARARYRELLVAYLQEHAAVLDMDSQRRLATNPLRVLDSKDPQTQQVVADAPRLTDSLDAESRRHFEGLCEHLEQLDIAYTLNPRLVRGLDYYSRTVFEWMSDELGAQATVCAGGRYDGLVQQLGGKRPVPAAGFALGMERLVEIFDARKALPAATELEVFVAWVGEQARHPAFALAEELRHAGYRVQHHCGGGGLKSQMRRADRSGAQVAALLGEDEIRAATVTIKPLRVDGAQASVPRHEALTRLDRLLQRPGSR